MIVLTDPSEIRKAARFVEKLAALETEFGYRLAVGTEAHLSSDYEPVTFGPDDAYAVIRSSDDDLPGAVALALIPNNRQETTA